MSSYLPVVFGKNKIEDFDLSINIEERKQKGLLKPTKSHQILDMS